MKVKYLKLKSWLLGTLVGTLGLGACHSAKKATVETAVITVSEEDITPQPIEQPAPDTVRRRPSPRNEIVLMYGVPTRDFRVHGQVVSTNGKPIEGIQVMILDNEMDATPDTIYGNPDLVRRYTKEYAVYTDRNGQFDVTTRRMPSKNTTMKVLVRDVDGKQNGSFQNRLIDINEQPDTEIVIDLKQRK